jgi:hypothetical protein
MNRQYLADSLDGFKGLVFRLLPPVIVETVACVPMTTDAPWTDAEKRMFETAVGIPGTRTYWTPGGFLNVPKATDRHARTDWIRAIAAIDEPHVFLDPDTGFYSHHGGDSTKTVLVTELAEMLVPRRTLIVYRHQYWPKAQPETTTAQPYVLDGLRMLRDAGFSAFAYQSQSASLFFTARKLEDVVQFETGLRNAFAGVSKEIVDRRLVAHDAEQAVSPDAGLAPCGRFGRRR